MDWTISQREQLELTVTALVPGAVGIMLGPVRWAGRAAFLAPWLALPVGLVLWGVWERIGKESGGLTGGVRRAFGTVGKPVLALYLLWGLFLLGLSARRCSDRLLAAGQTGTSGWAILPVALLLTLWLGRSRERFTGTGRIFYLSTAVTLALVGILSLPSLRWENLISAPEGNTVGGLFIATGWVLSLTGYVVYLLCIPRHGEGGVRTGSWMLWSCAGLSALLLTAVGAFGPALVLQLDEPILYILKGVGVPGAFQRGEAVLAAVLAFSDLILMGILAQGCIRLWMGLGGTFNMGMLLAVIGFSGAVLIPAEKREILGKTETVGNLIFGTLLPVLIDLRLRKERNGKEYGVYCGKE